MALLSIARNRVNSVINIVGLTAGFFCALLIFIFVQDELSYDSFHNDAQRIYRVSREYKANGYDIIADFPAAMKSEMKSSIPGITHISRYKMVENVSVYHQLNAFKESGIGYGDPEFLDLFKFPLKFGDKETALLNPKSVILTSEIAKKYFNENNPIGQTILINKENFTITGVFKKIPTNTHFNFSMLASFNTIEDDNNSWVDFPIYPIYLKIDRNVTIENVANQIKEIYLTHFTEIKELSELKVTNRQLENVYFNLPRADSNLHGSVKYIKLFSTIAIFILLVASINYINLATAQASKRFKEVGVRKTSGAFRSQLFTQFMIESVMIAFASAILSIGLIEFALPGFNNLTGKTLDLNLFRVDIFLGLLGIVIISGLLAGIYPAIVLSSFSPSTVFRGTGIGVKSKAKNLRKGLVVFQFILTAGLIFCASVFNDQFSYLLNRGTGIKTNSLISIRLSENLQENFRSFKNELVSIPEVTMVTNGRFLEGSLSITFYEQPENGPKLAGDAIAYLTTDKDVIETLGFELLEGESFNDLNESTNSNSIIVNQKTVTSFGYGSPAEIIGKQIPVLNKNYKIIGVVNDFNNSSAKQKILPTAIMLSETGDTQAILKINSSNYARTIASLKSVWKEFEPYTPFEFKAMDESIVRMYKVEHNLRRLFAIFSTIAILISSLGLYGLIIFTIDRKRKEIGIRKVFGATIKQVINLIGKDYLWLIMSGVAIGIPVSWYFMKQWLENYTIRIEMGLLQVSFTVAITILITLFTVTRKSVLAAKSNPIDTIRTE